MYFPCICKGLQINSQAAPKDEKISSLVLLIALGLADVNYGDWFRWSGKFQLQNLVLTSLILLVGLAVGY